MKRLLVALLTIATLCYGHSVLAQTAPRTPTGAPGTAPMPGATNSTDPGRGGGTSYAFHRVEGTCLEEGQLIRLLGKGFSRPRRAALEITLEPGGISLPILSVRDGLITSRLQKQIKLEEHKNYRFQIKVDKRLIEGTGNTINIQKCASAGANPNTDNNTQDYLPAEILILLPQSAYDAGGISQIRADLVAAGYVILEDVSLNFLETHLLRLKAPSGQKLSELIENLRLDYPDAEIDFNHISRLANGRKSYAQKLTGLPTPPNICEDAEENNIRVGIIDGAPDMRHSALQKAKDVRIARFGDGPPSPPIASAHGTAITALFKGQDNALSLRGLLPNARVFVADILGQDTGTGNSTSLLKSFNWLIKVKSEIISISMEGPYNRAVASTIEKIDQMGILIVAASGNGGLEDHPIYPAAYPSVIAVTAVGPTKSLYSKANRGSFIDIAAPGVGIWTARKGEGASYQSGTSFAVPFAVLKTALILSDEKDRKNRSPEFIRSQLATEAIDLGAEGKDPLFGFGLLQFKNCL
ncbi:MAG: S8 family serine peptidase [Sneathiella sp.]|nr:S8 family serine peptidase [Sneathiella sp.]